MDQISRSRRLGCEFTTMTRTQIADVQYDFNTKVLLAELHADIRSQQSLRNAILRYGWRNRRDKTAAVPICVRLTRRQTGIDPIFEALGGENLFTSLNPTSRNLAIIVLVLVYGRRPRDPRPILAPPQRNISVVSESCRIHLCNDRARAVSMGEGRFPLPATQAALGTGKTLVGALIAARHATPGELVIAIATTNAAVAQFTETLLSLDEYRYATRRRR
nr:unnamed protein product [Haemonchus contortus]